MALNEAVQQMVNASDAAAKEEWVATVTQLLLGIEQALSADSSGSILKESSSGTGLIRLTSNLIQVTLSPFLPCPSRYGSLAAPFLILHQLSWRVRHPKGVHWLLLQEEVGALGWVVVHWLQTFLGLVMSGA